MGLEDLGRELFPRWTSHQSLAGKVKQERIVVVELIENCTVFLCDEPLSEEGGREKGERENRKSERIICDTRSLL